MSNFEMEEMAKLSFEEIMQQSGDKYKCSNCGIVNECNGVPPAKCIKCENTKFYKI